MRLFTAIAFDTPSKDRLSRHIAALKKSGAKGNFTRHDNLHLTLAFIGETDRIAEAKAAVDACAADFTPFTLHIEGSGKFGDIHWAGVSGDRLIDLGNGMAEQLRTQGFSIEKRSFRAHITLARKYSPGKVAAPVLRPFDYPVTALSLMESSRRDGKLTYTEIYRKEL